MFVRFALSVFVALVWAYTPTIQGQEVKIDGPPPPAVEFARIVRVGKDKSFVVLGVQESKIQKRAKPPAKKGDKAVEFNHYVIFQTPWKIDLSKAMVLLSLKDGELKRIQGDELLKRLTPANTVALVNIDPAKFDLNQLSVVQENLLVFVTGQRMLSEEDLPKE